MLQKFEGNEKRTIKLLYICKVNCKTVLESEDKALSILMTSKLHFFLTQHKHATCKLHAHIMHTHIYI